MTIRSPYNEGQKYAVHKKLSPKQERRTYSDIPVFSCNHDQKHMRRIIMNFMKLSLFLLMLTLIPMIAFAEVYDNTEAIPLNAPDSHVIGTPWIERLVDTPELIVPATLDEWTVQRADTRDLVIDVLGNIPAKPENIVCETAETGETPTYTFEKFYLDNGYPKMSNSITGKVLSTTICLSNSR